MIKRISYLTALAVIAAAVYFSDQIKSVISDLTGKITNK